MPEAHVYGPSFAGAVRPAVCIPCCAKSHVWPPLDRNVRVALNVCYRRTNVANTRALIVYVLRSPRPRIEICTVILSTSFFSVSCHVIPSYCTFRVSLTHLNASPSSANRSIRFTEVEVWTCVRTVEPSMLAQKVQAAKAYKA